MHRTVLYFAYGSNLYLGRLLARVPSVGPVEVCMLDGHILIFNKRGRDGSAKCNIVPDIAGTVLGVVYQMAGADQNLLDRAEGPEYRRTEVEVLGADSGARYRAGTYVAKRAAQADGLLPFHWYKAYVIAGAEQHGMPVDYVESLRATPSRPDPNERRDRTNSLPDGASTASPDAAPGTARNQRFGAL